MLTSPADDSATVLERERRLLEPSVRRSPEAVRALLHAEFREVGASGQLWTRDQIVAALANEPRTGPAVMADVELLALGPDARLVTYEVARGGRRSRRCSIWVRADGAWLLRYHQGTRQSVPV